MKRVELHIDTTQSGKLSFLSAVEAVRLCAKAGCAAAAITDSDSVSAYLDAEQEARRLGIRLIHGLTVRCADREDEYDLTLLAKNQEGLQNLFALFALSHADSAPARCIVTRQQVEKHRNGLLVGADGRNGQIVRAILSRKAPEVLDAAAEGYDYLELPPEPHGIRTELCRIAQRCGKILCAVQYACAGEPESSITEHAFRAISLHRNEQANWSLFRTPERLEQDFGESCCLAAERLAVDNALWDGPNQILSMVEEFPPLFEQMSAAADRMHADAMEKLRRAVNAELCRRYQNNPPKAAADRAALELRRVDEEKSAPGLLLLARTAAGIREQGGFFRADDASDSSFLLYLLGAAEINPLPRHGYCHACNHWALLSPGESAPDVCPRCGAAWEMDGYDLLSVPLPSRSGRWRNVRTLSVSQEASNRILSLAKAFDAQLVKAFLTVFQAPDTEAAGQIIKQYVDCHPENPSLKKLLADAQMSFLCSVHAEKPALRFSRQRYLLLPEKLHALLPVMRPEDGGEPVGRLLLGSFDCCGLPELHISVSPALDALQQCSRLANIPPDRLPLHEPAVWEALSKYLLSEKGDAAQAACALCGVKAGERTRAFAQRMPICNLPQLARFLSAVHARGLEESSLLSLIDGGTLAPQKAIVCREDVYRYLKLHGAEDVTAQDWMKRTVVGNIRRDGCSSADLAFLNFCGADHWFAPLCEKTAYLPPEGRSFASALMLIRLVWYAVHAPDMQRVMEEIAASAEYQ